LLPFHFTYFLGPVAPVTVYQMDRRVPTSYCAASRACPSLRLERSLSEVAPTLGARRSSPSGSWFRGRNQRRGGLPDKYSEQAETGYQGGYASKEHAPLVRPALVVQVEDATKRQSTKTDIPGAIAILEDALGPLGDAQIAHSFQEGQA
jgi:hypothetical protein